MSLRKTILILLMVLAASFAGGAFSHWMLTGRPALAQETGNPKWVRTVTLYLVDESSDEVRGTLTIDGGTASLSLRDEKGIDRLELGVSSGGTPTVKLFGADRSRAELTVDGGNASFELIGPGGSLAMDRQDGPTLELMGSNGRTGASLSLREGEASLQLFDSSGQIVWQAPPVAEEAEESP